MSILTAFPADDPIWNTGGTNRTTPLDGKQAIGWEIDEEPPSGYFNWWQFYVWKYIEHYKVTAAALNDGKVDRAGDLALAGDFSPDFDGAYSFGAQTKPWLHIWAYDVHVNNVVPRPGIATADLGASGNRFRKLWISNIDSTGTIAAVSIVAEDIDSNTLTALDLTVVTEAKPSVAGVATNGTNALPWSAVVGRILRAKDIVGYRSTQPASPTDQITLNQRNQVLAAVYCDGTAGGAGTFRNEYNVTTKTRTGVGAYTITIPAATRLPEDAICIATLHDSSGGGGQIIVDPQVGGTSIQVNTKSATGIAADLAFSLVVFGAPFAVVTDPIA